MKAFILTAALIAGSFATMAQTTVFAPPHSDAYVPCCKTPLFTSSLTTNVRKALKTKLTLPGDTDNRVTPMTIMPDKAPTNSKVDRMPIAILKNTDLAMPIIKIDRTSYNMPIVGKETKRLPKEKIIAVYKSKDGSDSLVVNN